MKCQIIHISACKRGWDDLQDYVAAPQVYGQGTPICWRCWYLSSLSMILRQTGLLCSKPLHPSNVLLGTSRSTFETNITWWLLVRSIYLTGIEAIKRWRNFLWYGSHKMQKVGTSDPENLETDRNGKRNRRWKCWAVIIRIMHMKKNEWLKLFIRVSSSIHVMSFVIGSTFMNLQELCFYYLSHSNW